MFSVRVFVRLSETGRSVVRFKAPHDPNETIRSNELSPHQNLPENQPGQLIRM